MSMRPDIWLYSPDWPVLWLLESLTWICEKRYYHQAPLCFFTFLPHRSPQPLPLPHIFQTRNIKWHPYMDTHYLSRVGSDCFEFSPGLLLASTCNSLYSLYLFKQDRSFNAESLMDMGKLLKGSADCLFFFFFGLARLPWIWIAKAESSPLRNTSSPSSPSTIKNSIFFFPLLRVFHNS